MRFALCEKCTRPSKECCWADKGLPVEGWTATPSKKYKDGYRVKKCPLFTDEKRKIDFNLTGAQNLANAVVTTATKDLNKAIKMELACLEDLKKLKDAGASEVAIESCRQKLDGINTVIIECENFFKSKSFEIYSTLNGKELLKKIEKMAYKGELKKSRKKKQSVTSAKEKIMSFDEKDPPIIAMVKELDRLGFDQNSKGYCLLLKSAMVCLNRPELLDSMQYKFYPYFCEIGFFKNPRQSAHCFMDSIKWKWKHSNRESYFKKTFNKKPTVKGMMIHLCNVAKKINKGDIKK